MSWQYNPYAPWVAFTSFVISLAARWVWKRGPIAGRTEFITICLALVAHGVGATIDLSATTLELKNVGLFFTYAGFVFVPVTALRFSFEATGRHWFRGPLFWAALIPSFALVLLYVTNRWHHLVELSSVLSPRPGFVMRETVAGPAFWVFVAWAYLLILAAAVVYASEVITGSHHSRRNALLLLSGTLVPWVTNLIFILGKSPDPALDLTGFGYAGTALLWAFALGRGRMLDLLPFARNRVFEMLSDPVFVLDAHGDVLDTNAAATRLTQFIPARNEDEVTIDGVTYAVGRSSLSGGEVIILRDVSVQRRAREEAEALASARAEFLARMSHEVRTPLYGLLGATELALDSTLDPKGRALLDVARRSGNALLAVVDEILTFSGSARPFTLEPVDLAQVVNDVGSIFSPQAGAKGLQLQVNVEPRWLRTDGSRLRQVLANLISNAIKFTASGTVQVDVSTSNDLLHIEVRDTGPGIDLAAQSRIFEPFVQADATISARFGGTGLGLSVVRELVTRLGGTIALQSTPGLGSCFTVSIPAVTALPEEVTNLAPTPRIGRVLVVDDHVVGREITRGMLEREGCVVDVAASGAQALGQATPGRYALILLDVRMPDLSGPEVLDRLRSNGVETPVIWLTADVLDPSVATAQGVLRKPFPLTDLRDVLSRFLTVRTLAAFPEVTAAFAESSARELDALERAVSAGDRDALDRLRHDLQGSAGLVGAVEVARLCAELAKTPEAWVLSELRLARERDLQRLRGVHG